MSVLPWLYLSTR